MGLIYNLSEFRRFKQADAPIRTISAGEEDKIHKTLNDQNEIYGRLFIFLIDTGCLIGEATSLAKRDISRKRVTLNASSPDRKRTIPLTSRAFQACSTEDSRYGPFTDVEWPRFREAWSVAKARAGLDDAPDLKLLDLRHTCAARLVAGGVSLARIQAWLGHKTLSMTMRYAHMVPLDLEDCIDILERKSVRT